MTSVPLSDFRVPDGQIAITLDLHGMDHPVSVQFGVDLIESGLQKTEQSLKLKPSDRRSPSVHVNLRNSIQAGLQSGADDQAVQGVGFVALWLALNHPRSSDEMRRKVSEELRKSGRAHITITSDEKKTWGFALAPAYVDLSQAMSAVRPGDDGVTIVADDPGKERLQ